MKRRIIWTALAACLAVTCFTACSKDQEAGKITSAPTASAVTEAPKPTATASLTATPTAGEPSQPTGPHEFRLCFYREYNQGS